MHNTVIRCQCYQQCYGHACWDDRDIGRERHLAGVDGQGFGDDQQRLCKFGDGQLLAAAQRLRKAVEVDVQRRLDRASACDSTEQPSTRSHTSSEERHEECQQIAAACGCTQNGWLRRGDMTACCHTPVPQPLKHDQRSNAAHWARQT